MKKLSKDEVDYIADDMRVAARENANQTVIDEHGLEKVKAEYGYLDNHPDWDAYFLASLEDCLTHPLDYLPPRHERLAAPYSERKLSDAELGRVIKAIEKSGLVFTRGGFRRR
jgi:hypothetical protein